MDEQNRKPEMEGLSHLFAERRSIILGAATLAAGLAVGAPALAQVASSKPEGNMDTEEVAKRLRRLEKQNERIINLLERIAASSPIYRGKSLPTEKPDFAKIEKELRATLTQPGIAFVLELGDFKVKEWICQAVLLHKVKDIMPHWNKITEVVNSVAKKCHVPGRAAGYYIDPQDPQRMIGTTIEFGYSTEVGYDYENEFHKGRKEQEKSKAE